MTDARRDGPVTLAAGETVGADGLGTATLFAEGPKTPATITPNDAFQVPDMTENLMSVGMIDELGGAVLLAKGACFVYEDTEIAGPHSVLVKSYAVGGKTGRQSTIGDHSRRSMMAAAPMRGTPHVWHRPYFHFGYENLGRAYKMVIGMSAEEVVPDPAAGAVCLICAEEKKVRTPFPSSDTTTELMELLHVDNTGPFNPFIGGSRHLITMLEDKTGTLVGVPNRHKSDVGKVVRSRIPQLERKCGTKLKRIRFDGAKEFVTRAMRASYDERGIDIQTTPPYFSQSNGKAERAIDTIKERERAAFSEANVGEEL